MDRTEYNKAYYARNRQRILDSRKAPDAKARAKVCLQRWYQGNLEHARGLKRKANRKWVDANREKFREGCRKFRRNNPDKVFAAKSRLRAVRHDAGIGTDRVAYAAFCKRIKTDRFVVCYWCGKRVAKKNRHIDHIIPLSRKGKDSVENLCCSCAACNQKKSNRLPEEFSGQHQLFGSTKENE